MPKSRRPLSKVRKRNRRSIKLREYYKNKKSNTALDDHTTFTAASVPMIPFRENIIKDDPDAIIERNNESIIVADSSTSIAVDATSSGSVSFLDEVVQYEDYSDTDSLESLKVIRGKEHKALADLLVGRRIVNLAHVLCQYETILRHPASCTGGKMTLKKESRQGLVSYLHFGCITCGKTTVLTTDPLDESKEINENFVWGSLSAGIGHSQGEELLSVLNIPCMAPQTFSKYTLKAKKDSKLLQKNQTNIQSNSLSDHSSSSTTQQRPSQTINSNACHRNNSKTSATEEDEFDVYGAYIAAHLRQLPLENALRLQVEIQRIITSERIACLEENQATPRKKLRMDDETFVSHSSRDHYSNEDDDGASEINIKEEELFLGDLEEDL